MVCKEDILLWFKESASYKRIDVICNLLNMCIPFELRFVGTFVETIGKHSYQELRGAELKANNPSEVAAEVAAVVTSGLSDGTFRRKITLYLSLLHSYNTTCAKNIFDVLTSSDLGEVLSKGGANSPTDGNVLEELLLLYTMALNHPAFSFEQHSCLGKILMQLLEEEKIVHSQSFTRITAPHNTLPKNYVVKTPLQEEIPPPPGIVPITMPPPGPPPGIPILPNAVCRDLPQPVVSQPPMQPPPVTSQWAVNTTLPPNPPSPHYTESSPVHSRTSSPVGTPPAIHPAAVRSQQLSRRPPFRQTEPSNNRKLTNCIEDKEGDVQLNQSSWRNNSTRCQNGLRHHCGNGSGRANIITGVSCQSSVNCQHVYCTTQLEALSLDPALNLGLDMSRNCSSSSESGRSSTSHSPPGTPHTSGRRKSDVQMSRPTHHLRATPITNGRVPSNPSAEGGGTSTVPTVPPPTTMQQQPPNAVVYSQAPQQPYTAGGAAAAYTIPPAFAAVAANRAAAGTTMFTYPPHQQNYRPPPFTYTQPNGEQLVYPYPAPFLPLIAAYPSQVLPPKLSCWNCGGSGHTGHDCTEPTIEEITRPGNYQIDFSTSTATPTPADCSASAPATDK